MENKKYENIRHISNNDLSDVSKLILNGNKMVETISIMAINVDSMEIFNCPNLNYIKIENVKESTIYLHIKNEIKAKINITIYDTNISQFTLEGDFNEVSLININILSYFSVNKSIINSLKISSEQQSIRYNVKSLNIRKNTKIRYFSISELYIESLFIKESIIVYLTLNNLSLDDLNLINIGLNDFSAFDLVANDKYYETNYEFVDISVSKFTIIKFLDSLNPNQSFLFKLDKVNFEKISRITLPNCEIKNELELAFIYSPEGLFITQANTKEKKISNLNVNIIYTTSSEGILVFDNIYTNTLKLGGSNLKLSTNVKNSKINNLDFKNFDNRGVFKIVNSEVIDIININNSDLNDVVFRPLLYNKLNITTDSFLGGLKIYGSEPISLESTKLERDEKQEFYRQLKQSAKNSNNRFLELNYKAKEMEYYEPSQNTDKIVHWFNAINAYGLDWGWPMVAMGIVNFVLWIPFATLLYSNHFGEFDLFYLCDTLCRLFKDFIFVYFQLLNPISRMSDFSNLKFFPADVSWIVHLLFITSKVLNSVFIYQIVTAFRKWVGKE